MADESIKFELVTSKQHVLECDAIDVTMPGSQGELGVLPGHLPLLTALRPGVLTVNAAGERHVFAISTGFAEVLGDRITILTDEAEAGVDINATSAQSDYDAAEKALGELTGEEFDAQLNTIRWHEARVIAAGAATPASNRH